jgi:hypothetical protein
MPCVSEIDLLGAPTGNGPADGDPPTRAQFRFVERFSFEVVGREGIADEVSVEPLNLAASARQTPASTRVIQMSASP